MLVWALVFVATSSFDASKIVQNYGFRASDRTGMSDVQARVGVAVANAVFGCGKVLLLKERASIGDCAKGALGGLLSGAGKAMVGGGDLFFGMGALGRLNNAVGNSIINNVIADRGVFDRVYIDIGFVEVEVSNKLEGLKVSPLSFIGFLRGVWEGHLAVRDSLSYLTPVFKLDRPVIIRDTGSVVAGIALGNNAFYWHDTTLTKNYMRASLRHEITHAIQFQDMSAFNQLSLGPIGIGKDMGMGLVALPGSFSVGHTFSPIEIEARLSE